MNRLIMASILILMLAMAGCTQKSNRYVNMSGMNVAVKNQDLEGWFEGVALPYIEWEVNHHQWLKGRPIQVVPMQNGEITFEGNALTLEFSNVITDRLASVRGATLAWHGSMAGQHHRSLKKLHCNDIKPAAVYLAIETSLTLNNHLRIDIRALDLNEGWIPGFAINYSGKIGEVELAALKQVKSAEHLRGLRSLPFNADQADTMASYFARNLSCLIQQLGEKNIRIYQQDVVGTSEHPTVALIFRLTDNYLNQLMQVEIVEEKDKANVILKREFAKIAGRLHMVWIQSVFVEEGRRIPGTDTEAYITL